MIAAAISHGWWFLLTLPVIFWLVPVAIGRATGWADLAARYGSRDRQPGNHLGGVSCAVNGVRYNHALTVGWSDRGLHLSMTFLVRAGHHPLFIPWEEIVARQETERWGTKFVRLQMAGGSTLALPRDVVVRFEDRLPTAARAAVPPSW